MSGELEYLMLEIEGWARGLPDNAVRCRKSVDLEDEYGTTVTYEFLPAAADACSLELMIVDDAAEGAVGCVLDSFARLAPRLGARAGAGRAVLFREPAALATEAALALCRAVSLGQVRVEAALWRSRLSATRGAIKVGKPPMKLSGIGGPFSFFKALAPTGLTRVERVDYRPWR